MSTETILDLTIGAALLLALFMDTTRLVRRAAVWYGKSLLRLVTFGAYPEGDPGPIERPLLGLLGLGGAAAALIYFLVRLAR
jgi:hypothetical protein